MRYQHSCISYQRALMAALNTPSESLRNQYHAKASQIGCGLHEKDKKSIQESVAVMALLKSFIKNGGINS